MYFFVHRVRNTMIYFNKNKQKVIFCFVILLIINSVLEIKHEKNVKMKHLIKIYARNETLRTIKHLIHCINNISAFRIICSRILVFFSFSLIKIVNLSEYTWKILLFLFFKGNIVWWKRFDYDNWIIIIAAIIAIVICVIIICIIIILVCRRKRAQNKCKSFCLTSFTSCWSEYILF